MRVAVDAVLAERTRLVRAGAKASVGGSLLAHLVIAGACAVAPLLAAQGTQEMPEFVPVYVVPAAALGVREPVQARQPTRPAPPEPEPESPKPAAPEVEEEAPQPKAEPVMASPEPRRKPPPSRPREPTPASRGEIGRREGSPTGSSTGSSPFGVDVSFAGQNFTYSYYIDQMLAMIHAQWDRPALGAEVEAAVFFRVRRDGSVSDLRVVESSGFNVFDLAGLRAVRQAAPLPRLPVSYTEGSLAVKLILR